MPEIAETLRERDPSEDDLLETIRREVYPILKKVRASLNRRFGKNAAVVKDYTVEADAQLVSVDATAGPVTVTLLPAADWHRRLLIVKADSSGNAVTIEADGAETINGSSSATLASQWDRADLVSDGENYLNVG